MLHCNNGLKIWRVSLWRAISLATLWKMDSMGLKISNQLPNPKRLMIALWLISNQSSLATLRYMTISLGQDGAGSGSPGRATRWEIPIPKLLPEELFDHPRSHINSVPYLFLADVVRRRNQDMVTQFAICRARARVKGNAVWLLHAYRCISTRATPYHPHRIVTISPNS